MKILFINPPSLEGTIYMKEIGRCGRKSVASELWPQTGLAYLAATSIQAGAEAKIMDCMAEKIDIHKTIKKIKQFQPEVIIVNTTTPTFTNDAKVIEIIKENLDCSIGLVGAHPSVMPKKSLEESKADFSLINEAELTIKDIIKNPLKTVNGLCYKSNDKIICNPKRDLVKDLDELPLPARHLLANHKYTMPLTHGKPFVTIISSRGCPYQCIFCRAGSAWGKRVRKRSVESVINEIKKVNDELRINYLVFMTDTFTVDKKWTIDLCKALINRKIKIKFLCNSRVDTIDKEMLEYMKKAGCISISYGVESSNNKILKTSKKGITAEKSRHAIKITKQAGISCFAYFIIGLPGETWSTVRQTIKFAIKTDPDYANFHIATPFPGTELYSICKEKGWLVKSEWESYEEQGSAVFNTPDLSAQDLVKAQKMAMKKFYLRPSKIIKEFLKIRNFADIKFRIDTALSII